MHQLCLRISYLSREEPIFVQSPVRAEGENIALEAINDLEKSGLIFREDMDLEFWKEAGSYKATIKRVSLADCFAIALANREQAILVTSDHHEFDYISEQEICQIMFIR